MPEDLASDLAPDHMADMAPDMPPSTPEQAALLAIPAPGPALALPNLSAPAHVLYTEAGRPHVYAANRLDMGRVVGFLVARDRFFVMDLQRRLGQGTIASLLGEAALANDIDARLTGMAHVTDRLLANMNPEELAYIDAYVEGINAYIAAAKAGSAPPPTELRSFRLLLGARNAADLMVPFTRRDVAAMIAVIMYQTNFDGGDVGRAARQARLDALFVGAPLEALRRNGALQDFWEDWRPIFPVRSAAGWGVERATNTTLRLPSAKPAKPTSAPKPAKRVAPALLDRAADRLGRLARRMGKRELENFGSNTWAVDARHTRDGSALVAGDGHLPLSVPALMYQIGLDTRVFGQPDGVRQAGLLITSLPVMAVGTNGYVAWSQVNPVADITDWYREELQLGPDGLPASSLFNGQQRPLVKIDESYLVANVPALGSRGRTETWPRWTTFDGRMIYDIEGRALAPNEQPAAGEAVVRLGDKLVVPGDTDNDGKITAISFDYTALDASAYVRALIGFERAKTVEDYRQATRGLIGNMLYSAVADQQGDILFTAYQAVPCRSYLPRDADRRWLPGADPTTLIDGTTYGGFTIPSDPDGKVDESQGAADPYRCVVPFDETPQAISPAQGFVVNANNQPAPITDDGALHDDPWYIGGPWSEVRADSIEQGLIAVTRDKTADIDAMATIQAHTRSRLGEVYVDHFIAAIARARALSQTDGPRTPDEARLEALYVARAARFDEVEARLTAWKAGGLHTPAGVETFYHPTVTEAERADSVATMIFNAWMPRVIQRTFDDERMDAAYRWSASEARWRNLKRMLDGRGPNNPGQLGSWNPATQESAFFDILDTPEIERSDEILLLALTDALAFLEAAPSAPGQGGFGTQDMSAWRWGLRHQVRFESLLADFLSGTSFENILDGFSITTAVLPLTADPLMPGDPRQGLKWFPRPGDQYSVDAASPGFSGVSFTYGSGPVMRMVIALKDGQVQGQNIIPGGQSALRDSPHYADQAKLWLANKTVPLRYTPAEVAQGATHREVFTP
jgi:penicillin amidase